MRLIRRIVSQLHRYVMWALLSAVLWAWIFLSFVLDTVPAKKVTIYTDTASVRDTALEMLLSRSLPAGIRMVKVHPFSYAAFDAGAPNGSDLYILPASELTENLGVLCPMDAHGADDYVSDGAVYGWRVYDAASGKGAAAAYLGYAPDEDCYLCAAKSSGHLGAWNGSKDSAAIAIAEQIIALP